MAALLCQSLCKLLGDCTSCISYPCQTCCSAASKMICSPFTPYLTVTIAFNFPLMMWGIETFENNAAFCEKAWWLWCNSIMAMVHIIGSCYIVYRIQEDKGPTEEAYCIHEDDPHGYSPHKTTVPQSQVQIVGFAADDVSGVTSANIPNNKGENGSNDSNDSKKPLTVEVPYHNMDHPQCQTYHSKMVGSPRSQVGSPRSLASPRSVTSKSKSPFRTIFSNCRDPGHCAQQQQPPNKIESVASLVAGLPDDAENDRANSLQRIGRVLCYDPGTAIYLFVAVIWVIWQSVGVVVAMSLASNNAAYVSQCDDIKERVVLSTICGFLYMMLVLFAFGCSLLCLR